MDSDNDSGNSNDGPIHRRRTQGTRPPPSSSAHSSNAINRISSTGNVDRTYHPEKEDEPYSDDDEIDEDEDEEEQHHRHDRLQSTPYSSSSSSSPYNYARYPPTAELALPTPVSPLSSQTSSLSVVIPHQMGGSSRKTKVNIEIRIDKENNAFDYLL